MKQLAFILLMLASSSVAALDIEQAYQLIPHQRTVFLLHQSTLPQSQARGVARLLSLVEQAMVERVNAMMKGPRKSGYQTQIDPILQQIAALQMPAGIQAARDHILTAIQQHRDYFELYEATDTEARDARQQLVQLSHRHLITAYQQLMKSYPAETRHNKQAFFDYLCALDFI